MKDEKRKEWAVKAIMYYGSIAFDLPEDMRETPEAMCDVLGDWLYDQGVAHDDIGDVCNLAVKIHLGVG